MPAFWVSSEEWLLRCAVGGAVLLAITWLVVKRIEQPAKQQRLVEWGMGAALLLAGLCWLQPWVSFTIHRPSSSRPDALSEHVSQSAAGFEESKTETNKATNDYTAASAAMVANPTEIADFPQEGSHSSDFAVSSVEQESGLDANPPASPIDKHSADVDRERSSDATQTRTYALPWLRLEAILRWLLPAYWLGAFAFLVRWLFGQICLARLIRTAEPPSESLQELLACLAPANAPLPRLRVSDSLMVPLCCGIWRPTILLPRTMAATGSENVLRWVLSHELAHLERRDAWTGVLFNLGKVIYFYVPWFWHLRRRAWLCQEYLADAAAADAETRPDYAQFLLGLTRTPALPAGATGVSGYSSDLFRRITMLLRSPISLDHRIPRSWSLVAASCLAALAVLLSGIGVRLTPASAEQAVAVKDETKKEETKKDEANKNETKKENATDPAKSSVNEIQQRLREIQLERQKAMEKMNEEMQKLQGELRKNMPQFRAPLLAANGAMAMSGPYSGFNPHDVRLGVRLLKPTETLADQLDLPKGQGLVIDQVMPETPAAKAGLKPHDILLEIGGKAVPDNPADFVNKIMADIKADAKVDLVVLRKGKKETIKDVTLPEAKVQPGGNPFGRAGAGGIRLEVPNINFPNIAPIPQIDGLPGFPGAAAGGIGAPPGFPGGAAPGGARIVNNLPGGFKGVMTTTFRNDDRFTTRHQEGSLIITVTGKIVDGKAKTSEIQVQDGTATNKYESVDKVPEQYRDKVKGLVDMSEKGSVKVEIKE